MSEPFGIVGLFSVGPVAPVCFYNNARHSSYRFLSCAISWYSKQDFKGGIVLFARMSPRKYWNVISWVGVPWETSCNNLFSFPAVCSCSLRVLNDVVSHTWMTSVGNLQSSLFFASFFLGMWGWVCWQSIVWDYSSQYECTYICVWTDTY